MKEVKESGALALIIIALLASIPVIVLLVYFVVYIIPFIPLIAKVLAGITCIVLAGCVYQGWHWIDDKRKLRYARLQFEQVQVKRETLKLDFDVAHYQAIQIATQRGYNVEITDMSTKIINPISLMSQAAYKALPSGPANDNTNGTTALTIPHAPPFSDVRSLVRPDRLVLCYGGNNQPVYGTVDDLLSTNVNGKPGRGKTSLLYFIIAQLLISHADITVYDPHGSMKELEGVFTYLDSYEGMSEHVPSMEAMLQQRLTAWKARQPINKPHLLVVDETPAIAAWETKQTKAYRGKQRDEPHNSVLGLVQTIILEARKLRVYVIIAGQSMPASILPTLARDNLSSHYVFFSSDSHAKMAGLEKDDIDELLPLLKSAGPGVCVFDAVRRPEAEIGAIPETTITDLLSLVEVQSPVFERWEEDEYPYIPLEKNMPFERSGRSVTGELVRDVKPLGETGETPREKPVSVTEAERLTIIAAARAQMQITKKEKAVRSQLIESQGWNNRMWSKVKQVLDEEGI